MVLDTFIESQMFNFFSPTDLITKKASSRKRKSAPAAPKPDGHKKGKKAKLAIPESDNEEDSDSEEEVCRNFQHE